MNHQKETRAEPGRAPPRAAARVEEVGPHPRAGAGGLRASGGRAAATVAAALHFPRGRDFKTRLCVTCYNCEKRAERLGGRPAEAEMPEPPVDSYIGSRGAAAAQLRQRSGRARSSPRPQRRQSRRGEQPALKNSCSSFFFHSFPPRILNFFFVRVFGKVPSSAKKNCEGSAKAPSVVNFTT